MLPTNDTCTCLFYALLTKNESVSQKYLPKLFIATIFLSFMKSENSDLFFGWKISTLLPK